MRFPPPLTRGTPYPTQPGHPTRPSSHRHSAARLLATTFRPSPVSLHFPPHPIAPPVSSTMPVPSPPSFPDARSYGLSPQAHISARCVVSCSVVSLCLPITSYRVSPLFSRLCAALARVVVHADSAAWLVATLTFKAPLFNPFPDPTAKFKRHH